MWRRDFGGIYIGKRIVREEGVVEVWVKYDGLECWWWSWGEVVGFCIYLKIEVIGFVDGLDIRCVCV